MTVFPWPDELTEMLDGRCGRRTCRSQAYANISFQRVHASPDLFSSGGDYAGHRLRGALRIRGYRHELRGKRQAIASLFGRPGVVELVAPWRRFLVAPCRNSARKASIYSQYIAAGREQRRIS